VQLIFAADLALQSSGVECRRRVDEEYLWRWSLNGRAVGQRPHPCQPTVIYPLHRPIFTIPDTAGRIRQVDARSMRYQSDGDGSVADPTLK